MKRVYVFGHKNPDTDSVCSAIALANLKNKLGMNCVPKVIGQINHETKFVLNYFNVQCPSYINDVRLQINDIKYTKKVFVNANASIYEAFNLMKKLDLTALPLVNDKKILIGYVTLKDMAKYLVGNRDVLETNLKILLETLDAKLLTNYKLEFKGNIKTVSFSTDTFIKEEKLDENTILIVGDRYKVIEHAIKNKVQLIILTRNRIIPSKLLKIAEKNKVSIISSGYTSFELCNKLTLSNYIKTINVTNNPKTVNIDSYYSDFVNMTKRYGYTNYPVVKKNNECLGVLKLSDMYNYEKKDVILVDHNNVEQSVDGIEEANILEIFDHHNLGNIGTTTPIYFTNRPVGCTGTIIYDLYIKENVEIEPKIAGLLISAILSDTLLLTSPITTNMDREAVNYLAKIAKLDIDSYGKSMIKAASTIEGLSVNELINQDFKSYSINDKNYGVAVITTLDFEKINEQLEDYVLKLNEMSENKYEAVLIFIVDVLKQGSYVIYNNKSEELIMDSFNLDKVYEGVFIPELMSRKKQIIPALIKVLEK